MAVQVPTPRQLGEVAEEMGLSLTEVDVQSFINLMRPSIAAYNLLDAMPDNLLRGERLAERHTHFAVRLCTLIHQCRC